MEAATTNSATERVLEYGALNTATPFWVACARFTWLVPIQKQPIACNFSAAFKTDEVICVFDRIPTRWASFILRINSSSGKALVSFSTFVYPLLVKSFTAASLMFSNNKILIFSFG